MRLSPLTLLMFTCALDLSSGPPLSAGVPGSVAYELMQGSSIMDDCHICDRAAITRPIEGMFLLAPRSGGDPGSAAYDLTAFAFSAPRGEYTGSGSGVYSVTFGSQTTQGLEATADINGAAGLVLKASGVDVRAPWPGLDITVTQTEVTDPLHVYTLRILAAPQVELVQYELLEESVLVKSCTPECRAPDILIPLAGTFLLGEIAGGPNPVSTYRVDGIDFLNRGGDLLARVAGAGFYSQGGEVALLQAMQLEVTVNDGLDQRAGVRFLAPNGPVRAVFPEIDVQLEEESPPFFHYSLRIVARPISQGLNEYRRGDVSSDGRVDLQDAMGILSFLFTSGAAPSCLDAADGNDDEDVDLADALYILFYLFGNGPAPPAPGPERCGLGATLSLGCNSHPPCGA